MKTTTRWQQAAETGWALRRSAPSQKLLAMTLGVTEPQMSKQIHGLRSCEAAAFYAQIRKLVAGRKTEAGHLIAGALAAAEEQATQLPEAEIRVRPYSALEHETAAQAVEDQAEYRVAVALGNTQGDDAAPEDLRELRDALEAHDEAVLDETAWHCTALVYNRALRVCRGWRLAPEVGS